MQVDVRKKVLWGQWAECALAGARNRHGWEMLRTNGGDDERAVAVCQIRPQRCGGGQGEPVPDSTGDSPISPDTPTRPILGTKEVIEVARGEGEKQRKTREKQRKTKSRGNH